jgi:hypothetical protein
VKFHLEPHHSLCVALSLLATAVVLVVLVTVVVVLVVVPLNVVVVLVVVVVALVPVVDVVVLVVVDVLVVKVRVVPGIGPPISCWKTEHSCAILQSCWGVADLFVVRYCTNHS